jgi:hypothetical protein
MREAKFNRYIAALSETSFVQAIAECRDNACAQLRHPGIKKSDHRHRCLLRTRRRRTPEQRDELAPLCMTGKKHSES